MQEEEISYSYLPAGAGICNLLGNAMLGLGLEIENVYIFIKVITLLKFFRLKRFKY